LSPTVDSQDWKLQVAENGRYLIDGAGKPFFWLADTAWLLHRLTREEIHEYYADRKAKGYNVLQVMALHSPDTPNIYGSYPLIQRDYTRPNVADSNDGGNYWDHLDYIIDTAKQYGLYIALVAVWGSNVSRTDGLTAEQAEVYGGWLAERYRNRSNLIWIIGGDARGNRKMDVWLALARTIRTKDPSHLMTFHPFGRTQSSTWFHHEPWLDFNMFQSGHTRYDQMKEDHPSTWRGEDNWRYVQEDYARWPAKPTLDGEPSYEGIPHGLHDPSQPRWRTDDVRRYAYWSVFAGACGHTYGHNAVMQMHKPQFAPGQYGVDQFWHEAIHAAGAGQMQHLKHLMLSRPYFTRFPDQTVIDGDPGWRYDHLRATRGEDYVFVYTYTGRPFTVKLGIISGSLLRAWWYDPRTGANQLIGELRNSGAATFLPPGGEPKPGNDWVLVLDDANQGYAAPGQNVHPA